MEISGTTWLPSGVSLMRKWTMTSDAGHSARDVGALARAVICMPVAMTVAMTALSPLMSIAQLRAVSRELQ